MLGGGQLGRMFTVAARTLGYRVIILEPDFHSPAAQLADDHIIAAYDDEAALTAFGQQCDVVTTEFENIPATNAGIPCPILPGTPFRPCGKNGARPDRGKGIRAQLRLAASSRLRRSTSLRILPLHKQHATFPPSSKPPVWVTTARGKSQSTRSPKLKPPLPSLAVWLACWNSGWNWNVRFP